MANLVSRALQGKRWRANQRLVQVSWAHQRLLFHRSVRNDPFAETGEQAGERQKQGCDANIEYGVSVGNLARGLGCQLVHSQQTRFRGRRDLTYELREVWYERDDENDTHNLEGDVGYRHSHRFPGFTNGRQAGGGTGPDICTESQRDSRFQADQSLQCHGDHHAHGGRRGLHQGGEQGCHQDADHRIGYASHQFNEGLVAAQRVHAFAHYAHTEENQAQAHDHVAVLLDMVGFPEKHKPEAYGYQQERVLGDLEGDDLGRYRGTNIGTEDHADGLRQRHQPGGDEPNQHDRRN